MRNKMTITQKRWLLSAHLLCTVAWLGAALCSLIFNITALITDDPHLLNASYVFADILDKAILRGGAVGALLTGLLLSVLTQWGLMRFYWIIVKEIVSVLCIVVGVIISGWNDDAIAFTAMQGLHALHDPLYLTNRTLMFLGIFFQLIALAGVIVISVFKPWGQRKRPGQRRPQKTGTAANTRPLVKATRMRNADRMRTSSSPGGEQEGVWREKEEQGETQGWQEKNLVRQPNCMSGSLPNERAASSVGSRCGSPITRIERL